VERAVPAVRSYLKDKGVDVRPAALGALTRRQLAEVSGDPMLQDYVRTAGQMEAAKVQYATEAADLAEQWRKDPQGDRIAELMHEATVAGVDPAEAYTPRITPERAEARKDRIRRKARRENALDEKGAAQLQQIDRALKNEPIRQKTYTALKRKWLRLSPEAKALYVGVRDAYGKRAGDTLAALEARIQRTEAPMAEKQNLVARLRREFESRRMEGPYFPLKRYGRYWTSYTNRDTGEKGFSMFESRREQRKFEKAIRPNHDIKSGTKLENADQTGAIPEGFAADVNAMVTAKFGDSQRATELKDEIYQQMLRSLPDLSARRQFIHRQNIEGFSKDALRSYASSMFHSGHQLARLQYSDVLQDKLNKAREGLRDMPDSGRATDYLTEFNKRHQWAMNPQVGKFAQGAGQMGFVWYLGATPAAAAINLTQVPLVQFPVLGARFGFTKAATALSKATADFVRGKGSIGNVVRDLEKRAFDELTRRGVIDKTMAHNLAELSETESAIYSPFMDKAMGYVSLAFHHAERITRETSAMASYRLARKQGINHDAAIDYAEDATYAGQFDYANANRARWMQGDIPRILLQFRQYSQSMSYLLARNLYQSTKGETPQVKREARTKLTAILGMHGLAAGVVGMPLFGLLMDTLDLVHDLFGDDEPWDARGAFRQWLADTFGPGVAAVVAKGPLSTVSGADFSARVGLDELWLRTPDRDMEGRDKFSHYLEEAAGPFIGIFGNAASGLDMLAKGHTDRALEKASPKAVRDLLKARRYQTKGVTTMGGAPLIESPTPWELALQSAGFTPQRLAERYDANNAIRRLLDEVSNTRQRLLDGYALADRLGDDVAMDRLEDRMEAFSEANPQAAIRPKDLRQSLKRRARLRETAQHGIPATRRNVGLIESMNWAQ